MESSSSSISEITTNQPSVNCSIAPLMTSESNRPFFIAICTEIICELDPLIIAELYDELQEHWTLIDGYGNNHEVEFNKSILMPMLREGWHQFRNVYNIISNLLMSYTYLGNSTFQIQIFTGSTPTNEYPRYHRLTTSRLKDVTFYVDVPKKERIRTKLILPPDLGHFLKLKNHEYLRLCGTSNTITICKLLFEEDAESNATTVIIGRGWRPFCLTNRIYPDSILQFMCDSIMAKNIVSVCKVSRRY
ncbi:uncharacterized protein [Medicago truncatula]|uniref:uncharacterized protein n=1 Tax=Medicago truncatula TaxID=3880 RepID=UPI0000D5E653|nr:uncharacterized protein LOC112422533 [Medicago truncatula]